ncbi:hypothetical protein GJ744_002804 [Endocarpon pusillum]|uniref:Uncharacterized protein n=1 Tax=Endocarpon pusillum TaxID=364733 RepID=A0A8H7AS85_9EURO|nr:hypothetical protein GJ744_002804 [Endocarpon pusillum]
MSQSQPAKCREVEGKAYFVGCRWKGSTSFAKKIRGAKLNIVMKAATMQLLTGFEDTGRTFRPRSRPQVQTNRAD